MAYVVQNRSGAWEIRESRTTAEGPRSRTLATFAVLTDEVMAAASARSASGLDPAGLRRAALRVGAPLREPAADRAAVELFGPEAGAETLVALAEAGDAAAGEALDTIGSSLGAAIGSFLNMFDPDVVIVGGGFGTAAGELILDPARAAARREAIHPAGERLRLVRAELGAQAGLVGAGLVAFEALDSAW